ncbi:hypothetical protein MUK42_32705 [Musa troglodytarum]|uniref:Uncharacterized protein n=1 Tax=Musa troglodytarum TaxID=320322 RepID=A0A9E7I8N7_9LILI|nr:hypothetical protein MUK42_32705 [Musa troglodytarum]
MRGQEVNSEDLCWLCILPGNTEDGALDFVRFVSYDTAPKTRRQKTKKKNDKTRVETIPVGSGIKKGGEQAPWRSFFDGNNEGLDGGSSSSSTSVFSTKNQRMPSGCEMLKPLAARRLFVGIQAALIAGWTVSKQ